MLKKLFRKRRKIAERENSFQNQYADFSEFEKELYAKVKAYTMTSPERLITLIRAVQYLSHNLIAGDFVECGVWKGGSVMAMLETLKFLGDNERKIWLFDTFEGMTEPSKVDSKFDGTLAEQLLRVSKKETSNVWAYSSFEETKKNVSSIGYRDDKINFIQGPVEQTLTTVDIQNISLLRLDTDWYESTKAELDVLYPKLVKGGVLIIDDYGHWNGCRKAVDEYFKVNKITAFFNRIDYTGRLMIKQ